MNTYNAVIFVICVGVLADLLLVIDALRKGIKTWKERASEGKGDNRA
jgi:hypothetical protein